MDQSQAVEKVSTAFLFLEALTIGQARIIPEIQLEASNVERKSRILSRNTAGGGKCGKNKLDSFHEYSWSPQMWKD